MNYQNHTYGEEKIITLPSGEEVKAKKCSACGAINYGSDSFNMVCPVNTREAIETINKAFCE